LGKKCILFCHHIHFQINYYLKFFDTFYPKKITNCLFN
jgi:hypothetical protein